MEPFRRPARLAGIGSFRCADCDYVVSLAAEDTLPAAPAAAARSSSARRCSRPPGFAGERPRRRGRPADWLAQDARGPLDEPGQYLAYDDAGDRVASSR